jgi:hypothetical protein
MQSRYNLRISQYEHGGSRIYLNDESGESKLLVDTYATTEFSEWIYNAVKAWVITNGNPRINLDRQPTDLYSMNLKLKEEIEKLRDALDKLNNQ